MLRRSARRNSRGVSPIIATVLMVGITIALVLAASLGLGLLISVVSDSMG